MSNVVISDHLKDEIVKFLKRDKKADLITTYLYFLEKKIFPQYEIVRHFYL